MNIARSAHSQTVAALAKRVMFTGGCLLLAGCSTCGRGGSGCDIAVIDAAAPVLLPVAVVAGVFRVASWPFDPVYPSLSASGKEVSPVRRVELPIPAGDLTVNDAGEFIAFSRSSGEPLFTCKPGHDCASTQAAAPAPRLGCVKESPDRAYCFRITPSGRSLIKVSNQSVIAAVPETFATVGLATVSDRGEVFSLATDGGYDQTDASGTRHHVPHGARSQWVARLGRRDRLVQLTGSETYGAPPPVVHLIDSVNDRDIASLTLPNTTQFNARAILSDDGTWLAVDLSRPGKRVELCLYRLGRSQITLFGVFGTSNGYLDLAFSPSGEILAVLGSGDHDRIIPRRVSIFRLPAS